MAGTLSRTRGSRNVRQTAATLEARRSAGPGPSTLGVNTCTVTSPRVSSRRRPTVIAWAPADLIVQRWYGTGGSGSPSSSSQNWSDNTGDIPPVFSTDPYRSQWARSVAMKSASVNPPSPVRGRGPPA